MTAKRRRRSPGEGSIVRRVTKAGVVHFGIKYDVPSESSARRQVLRWRDSAGNMWLTEKAALAALREALGKVDRGQFTEPSRQLLAAFLDEWLGGLRLAPSTVASYRKNIRLHVTPYIGAVPLASLTTARIDALYRQLERAGRADHREGEGLSPRTVRYIGTILGAALAAAVDGGQLAASPAARAHPPTAKQAQAPEMHPWTAAQLRAFLGWSAASSQLHAAWHTLAMTGMRRGELLALRWRDIDLDAGTVSVRRSAGIVRNKGEGAAITEGPTKTNRPRLIDLDAATVALLRALRRERGSMALAYARDDAVAFGDHEGRVRHPERFSRLFAETLARCRRDLGDGGPPAIRLHDLRHTHATLLLADREPIKTVSERLGHASVTVTLSVYGHVMPGDQKRAADRFAALIEGATSS